DRRDIAIARDGNADRLFNLFDEVPICQAFIALLTRPAMHLDVLDAALLGHFGDVNDIYRRVGIPRTELERQRDRNSIFYAFENFLEQRHVAQKPRTTAVL